MKQDGDMQSKPRPRRRRVKRLLAAVGIFLLALVLIPLTLILLRPTREALLRKGLSIADGKLPGHLRIADPGWPRLGRLHFADLAWIADNDTLLACDLLSVDLAVTPLFRKSVEVRHLRVEGLTADLPALQAALPPAEEPVTDPPPDDAAPLDIDSLITTLPRVAVDEVLVTGRDIRVAPAAVIDGLFLSAQARLGQPEGNRVALDSLVVRDAAGLWTLERCGLTVDLDDPGLSGGIGARVNRLRAELLFEGDYDGRLVLRVSPIRLIAPGDPAAELQPALDGEIVVDPVGPRIEWSRVGVDGALGVLVCEGGFLPPGRLNANLDGVWTEAPEAGLRALLPDSLAAALPDLVGLWPPGGPKLRAELAATSLDPPTADVDLTLDLPGLTVAAAGGVAEEQIDLRGEVDLTDLAFARALAPAALTGVDGTLRLDLTAAGPPTNPRVDLSLEAAATTPDLTVPRLTGRLTEAEGRRRLTLSAPEGIRFADVALDSLDLAARVPADTLALFPLDLILDTGGELAGLGLALTVSEEAGLLRVTGDSLGLRVTDRTLSTRAPFDITVDPAAPGLTVTGLALAGDLGGIAAEGRAAPDSLDLALLLDLMFPPDLLARLLPEEQRPRAEALSVTTRVDLKLAGPATAPDAALAARVGLREADSERALDLALNLELDSTTSTGVSGTLLLADERGELLAGEVALPGRYDPALPGWSQPADAPLTVALGPSTLEFARLEPYLPPLLDLEGTCRLELSASGFGDSLGLAGRILTEELVARWDRQSWVAVDADLKLAGDTRRPGVRGEVATRSGIIHLPPPPRVLLPDTGGALLWDAALEAEITAGDDLIAPPAAKTPPPLPELDVKVVVPGELWLRGQGLELELGGELRVTSSAEGPDAGLPLVAGEFGLKSGHYDFLGRRFELERGVATLFGERDPDPDLDVVLVSRLGDTKVSIVVGGTAKEPTLRLESVPERSEGEIVALLLSGGASDEGGEDPGAKEQLRSAAAGLLGALGSATVRRSLARHTGLDQVEYREDEEGGRGSMMLGKYLSPRLLLRYEQGLEERTDFVVHLRYLLNRYWKVETSYAQDGDSGLELHWSRED